jgi:hypothetical protein
MPCPSHPPWFYHLNDICLCSLHNHFRSGPSCFRTPL